MNWPLLGLVGVRLSPWPKLDVVSVSNSRLTYFVQKQKDLLNGKIKLIMNSVVLQNDNFASLISILLLLFHAYIFKINRRLYKAMFHLFKTGAIKHSLVLLVIFIFLN